MSEISVISVSSAGVEFATLSPDGTATIDWPQVQLIAADVRKKMQTSPEQAPTMWEAIACLLWAVAQPGVKP